METFLNIKFLQSSSVSFSAYSTWLGSYQLKNKTKCCKPTFYVKNNIPIPKMANLGVQNCNTGKYWNNGHI
jgi:hypothetical protein